MTFDEFTEQVRGLLEPTAIGKGYNTTGVDGHNDLYEFVQGMSGDGHALGEIVYKAKRYAAKGNPEDVLKIAAWAFLILKHRQTKAPAEVGMISVVHHNLSGAATVTISAADKRLDLVPV